MEEIDDTGGKPETWDSITGLLSDTTGFVDDLTIRSGDDLKSLRPVPIPDYYSVTINWTEMPRGGVKRVDLMTGGFGYIIPPSTFVSEQTGSYVSQGLGATLLAKGDTIGGIKDIKITQNDPNDAYDGFGIGYVTPPTLDLTGLGDGTAVVVPITGPLCVRDGSFVSDQGFLSDNNRIHIKDKACGDARNVNLDMVHLPSCQMIRYKPTPLPRKINLDNCPSPNMNSVASCQYTQCKSNCN